MDAFAVKPAKTCSPGAFDDPPDHAVTFWGAYAVTPFPVFKQASVDLYYLGLDRKSSTYDQGTAREQRHSVGARIWREQAPWDYNFELVYQWGRFGSAPIRAWTLASDTGLTLEAAALAPALRPQGGRHERGPGPERPEPRATSTRSSRAAPISARPRSSGPPITSTSTHRSSSTRARG